MPYYKPLFLLLCLFLPISVLFIPLPPKTSVDILIIAPHPDDAVLCCSGVIQQALAQKKHIRIINVTDGDGYLASAAKQLRIPIVSLTPQDLRRFGNIRQREERKSLQVLGVPVTHVTFLGYPDGWLEEVYNTTTGTPRVHPVTGKTSTIHGAPFTQNGMLTDLYRELATVAPRQIYIPAAQDGALDHQMVYRAAMDVINQIGYTGSVFTYRIHTADNSIADAHPAHTVTLSPHEQWMKREAIARHISQMRTDREFLMSFVTESESFY